MKCRTYAPSAREQVSQKKKRGYYYNEEVKRSKRRFKEEVKRRLTVQAVHIVSADLFIPYSVRRVLVEAGKQRGGEREEKLRQSQ